MSHGELVFLSSITFFNRDTSGVVRSFQSSEKYIIRDRRNLVQRGRRRKVFPAFILRLSP